VCVPPELWATSDAPDAFVIGGAGGTFSLPIRSLGGIEIGGVNQQISGGVRYATSVKIVGTSNKVKAPINRQTDPVPSVLRVADFRTDASIRAFAPTLIPLSKCVDNVWTASIRDLDDNTVYLVPCDVQLSGSGSKRVAIVTDGAISLSGAGVRLGGPVINSTQLNTFTAGGEISISGAGGEISGPVVSDTSIALGGAGNNVCGGFFAPRIEIGGANNSAKPCEAT
jgi:hypothetical protein